MGSFGEAFQLIAAGMKPEELAQARASLEQNTLAASPGARRWWWPFPGGGGKAIDQLVAPDFDGSRRR